MAAGKSTIGRKLARRLDCTVLRHRRADRRAHGAIGDIFTRRGRGGVSHATNAHAIGEVLESAAESVVALGGGALTVGENRQAARAPTLYRVFIKALAAAHSRAVAAQPARCGRCSVPTPTLCAASTSSTRTRMPQYESADHVVEADRRQTHRDVIDDIVGWLRKSAKALDARAFHVNDDLGYPIVVGDDVRGRARRAFARASADRRRSCSATRTGTCARSRATSRPRDRTPPVIAVRARASGESVWRRSSGCSTRCVARASTRDLVHRRRRRRRQRLFGFRGAHVHARRWVRPRRDDRWSRWWTRRSAARPAST